MKSIFIKNFDFVSYQNRMTTKTGVSSNVDIEVVVSEFVKRFDWKDLGVNIADFDRLRKNLEEFFCAGDF